MEKDELLRKIADRLLECITEQPDGDVWSEWRIDADGRHFTCRVYLKTDYIEERGVEFMGDVERRQRAIPARVMGLEVYETDARRAELDEELWDVPGNSERIMIMINDRLRTRGR